MVLCVISEWTFCDVACDICEDIVCGVTENVVFCVVLISWRTLCCMVSGRVLSERVLSA